MPAPDQIKYLVSVGKIKSAGRNQAARVQGLFIIGKDIMTYKILGISGSPVKKGNVEKLLNRAMEGLPAQDIERDIVHLSGLKIKDCIHCNFCLTKQTPGKYCAIKDDAQAIFEKAEAADIIILASPVYFMRTSARMAALIDRFRVFVFGNIAAVRMKNKIGVSRGRILASAGRTGDDPPDAHPGISHVGGDSGQRPQRYKPFRRIGLRQSSGVWRLRSRGQTRN